MNETIQVRGLQETQAALYSYSQQMGDLIIRRALRQGANYVKRGIQGLVPTKTGTLKRKGFRVSNSKIYNGRRTSDVIGVYLTLRQKKKGDPFYGRFQNDGWNTHGKSATRAAVRQAFGGKTGRKTLTGKTNVPGKQFIQQGFETRRLAAADLIIRSAESGAEAVKRRLGLKG